MPKQKEVTLEDFCARLLEEKGLEDLDRAVFIEMRNDLVSRLDDRITAGLIEALPVEKREELDKMTENEDDVKDAQVQKFFVENIENFPDVFAGILMKFRSTYLGL